MMNTTISTQPFLLTGDPYEFMKNKTQNKIRYTGYISMLWNTLLDMFEYENLPDTIPKRFLESILHATGEVFISKINDELIASHGTLSGDVDAYGLGTDVIAVCPTGEAHGKRGVDIAYGINNDTATPDMLVYWIAHLLGETDKSIKLNVLYSRFLKIPKVCNEKDKAMFEGLVKKLIDGEAQAFASSNALDLELGAGTEAFELTDVNKIDKLPYLTQFFEDCLKRFYNFYGQPMQNQNKRAQSISDEIHGQDSVSFIIPMQMLRCRQALCEEVNRIFGTDISVKFSPVWRVELAGLIERDGNGNEKPDIIETASEQVETKTEQVETETEQVGTKTEQDETIEEINEPDEPSDLPAMTLEPSDPTDTTNEETESETGANTGLISIKEVADAFNVSEVEVIDLLELMKGGD